MVEINLKGSIYDKLASPEERKLYGIIADHKKIGGRELTDSYYIENFVKTRVPSGKFYFYSVILKNDESELFVCRLTVFDNYRAKAIWASNKYIESEYNVILRNTALEVMN
jgi:hypothetical protein